MSEKHRQNLKKISLKFLPKNRKLQINQSELASCPTVVPSVAVDSLEQWCEHATCTYFTQARLSHRFAGDQRNSKGLQIEHGRLTLPRTSRLASSSDKVLEQKEERTIQNDWFIFNFSLFGRSFGAVCWTCLKCFFPQFSVNLLDELSGNSENKSFYTR